MAGFRGRLVLRLWLNDNFAKGLVLPIEIKPDGKKSGEKAHGAMKE
ncbi:hypothetical protein ACTXGK_00400 [Psychrobacter sp. T6-5]